MELQLDEMAALAKLLSVFHYNLEDGHIVLERQKRPNYASGHYEE